MTDAELEAIKDRLNAATPGPWYVEPFGNPDEYEIGCGDLNQWGHRGRVVSCGEPAEAQGISLPDAEFIAHAREDVATLLAAVEKLHETLDYTY